MIYADNAATTQLSKTALKAMMPWLLGEYGNASQLYSFARKPKKALFDARKIIAECINANPEEIFFTSGGTESNNWAIKGSAFSDCRKGEIITSAFEHHAVLRSCAAIEQLGYYVSYLMPTPQGVILPTTLSEMLCDKTRLVSIMLANNEIGTIQPIKALCKAAHSHGALFHTDAVQAVGHVNIDVRELGVDMLSASAHKFNGPKGIGFLYIRKGVEILPYLDGGKQENQYRAGTENIASIVGMAAALKENCDTINENIASVRSMEFRLLDALCSLEIPFIRNGGDNTLPGLVSLSFDGADGEKILHRMDLAGISISTGSACNSTNTEISHVLQAIKLNEAHAKGTIRISLGKSNTLDEIDSIINALIKILR